MTALALEAEGARTAAVELFAFGPLAPISRQGGQGRVHLPASVPAGLGGEGIVVKLYRAAPGEHAARVLAAMTGWRHSLEPAQRAQLDLVTAWPLANVTRGGGLVGIAMRDVRPAFEVSFTMPSGRRERVLLGLEHLLGGDGYLRQRGLGVMLDTPMRLWVAERIATALALLHRHAIIAADIAPSNVLVSFAGATPAVCIIDCDSMVFRGCQALPSVETVDWQMPAAFDEPVSTRAADAYKLGLVILRLLARSHAERALAPNSAHVPAGLRPLLARALSADARNRPPAGEWARALRVTLADPGLPRRRPAPPVPAAAVAAARRPQLPPAPLRVARAPLRRRRSRTAEAARTLVLIIALLLCGFILVEAFDLAVGSGQPTAPQGGGYLVTRQGGGFQPGAGPVGP